MVLIDALRVVADEPATTTRRTLAKRLGIGKMQAECTVREMEAQGWAEEVAGFVLLTEEGEAQVEKTSAPVPRFFRDAEEPQRLSPAEVRAWKCIARNPGIKPKGLSKALDVSPGHARVLVHGLCKAGQIERGPDGGYTSTKKSRDARLRETLQGLRGLVADLAAILGD